MDKDIGLGCPIHPYELDKAQRRGMESIVRRVARRAVFDGDGNDLLLRVYLSGIYHGVELSKPRGGREMGR